LRQVAFLLFPPLPAVVFDRFDTFDLDSAVPIVVGGNPFAGLTLLFMPSCSSSMVD
jgi:hypothetical protein